jgi:hypothetical protein
MGWSESNVETIYGEDAHSHVCSRRFESERTAALSIANRSLTIYKQSLKINRKFRVTVGKKLEQVVKIF